MATIATIILRHRTLRIGAILSSSSTSSCSFFSHSTTGADPDAASQQEKTCEVSSPPPIRVSLTEDYGRGVFASRPISAGDLIHTASPVVAHPSPSLVNKICYSCLRRRGSSDAAAATSDRYFCCDVCRKKSEDFLEKEDKLSSSAFDRHCMYEL